MVEDEEEEERGIQEKGSEKRERVKVEEKINGKGEYKGKAIR